MLQDLSIFDTNPEYVTNVNAVRKENYLSYFKT